MIRVTNLHFERDRSILNNLNFTLKKGEVFGIVGPSGAGKSTLLSIMAGLLDASKGEVKLGSEIIYGPKDRLLPGHPEVQLVNQEFGLDIYHTVSENLRVKANHLTAEMKGEFIAELLDLMELTHIANHKAIQLSGGEKQRLAMARAIIMEPKVILLDEPFAHMDAHIKRKVIAYLLALKKSRKTTFVFVTHDGQDVMTFADRIAYFNQGQIQRIDTPEAFYRYPTAYEEGLFFGELNSVKQKKETLIFRPNQFSLDEQQEGVHLEVKFLDAAYAGIYYLNYFRVGKNERIVLYHTEILNHAHKIVITKN
jgi:iron(III) transport system ATP-binding protein